MTTTVTYVHPPNVAALASGFFEECEECEIEVSMTWEPEEKNYGADADGNRGITVPGYFTDHEFPDACPGCGHVYTAAERRKIERWAEEQVCDAADDYDSADTVEERD